MLTLAAVMLAAPLVAGHVETPEFVDVQAESLQWVDAPGLAAGAKVAVVYGDLTKAAPFVIRLRFPADFKIMPHSHAQDEFGTILSGRMHLGHGDSFDVAAVREFGAGDFFFMRGGARHYVHTIEPVEIELHGVGPWSISYVNPSDDPRS